MGCLECVDLLLARSDVELNRKTIRHGTNALITALVHRHIGVANRLLAHRDLYASVKRKNGDTALHVAAYFGYTNISKKLLDRGIYASSVNRRGLRSVDYAVERRHSDIVQILSNYSNLGGNR